MNGDVYFIQADEPSGLIKIGLSTNPLERLKQLRTASPHPLRLLAVLPGAGSASETRYHRTFAEERVLGEWFRPSQRLMDHIYDLIAISPPAETRIDRCEEYVAMCFAVHGLLLDHDPDLFGGRLNIEPELMTADELRAAYDAEMAAADALEQTARRFADLCEEKHGVRP